MLMETLRTPSRSRSWETARGAVSRRRWRSTGRRGGRRRRQAPVVESAAQRPTPAVLVRPTPVRDVPDLPAHVRQRQLVLASLVLCPQADLGKRHENGRP
jgi:hypothetical protein